MQSVQGIHLKIRYENAKFEISISDPYQRGFIRRSVKRKIAQTRLISYRSDPYLTLCNQLFSTQDSGLIIDVGANVGFTAIPIASRFPKMQVIAVEPHPIASGQLMKNIRLNTLSNIHIVSAAIGSDRPLTEISSCPTNSGGNRLSGFEGRADLLGYSDESASVSTVSLEYVLEYFSENSECSLLKIDTEGYELHVLRSLGDKLSPTHIKNIVAEYGPEGLRSAGSSGAEIVELMMATGYNCKILQTGNEIDDPTDLPHLPDFGVLDLVFSAT